jgi:tagatose-1,6-bisphosphate aldolase non-catalytic subunit AgaZ/GatZ
MTALPFCIIPNERKATKQQIMLHGATNTDSTATNAYVRNGNNRLNQLRQFAYDGRYWYYQPGSAATGEKFRKVDAMDIPEPVINDMANYIGTIPEKLKERD